MSTIGDQNSRLGQLLIQSGLLTEDQMNEALIKLKTEKGSLLTVLVDMGVLPFSTVSRFVEKSMGMKTFTVGDRIVDLGLIQLVG